MQISELAQGVAAKLKQSRIVFWYDPEQSFTEELEHLANDLSSAKEFVAKEAHSKETDDKAADITARVLPNDLTILNMGNESVLAVKNALKWMSVKLNSLSISPAQNQSPTAIGC